MMIKAINALKDNYIWAIIDTKKQQTIIVDPGEAEPVLDFLQKENLKLHAILITHHHWDHCNGIDEIKKQFDVPVYGPKTEKIPHITHPVQENDQIDFKDMQFTLKVLDIPGHTLGHVAYVDIDNNVLFCGDTLFSSGCGRIFEGTFEMMYDSLQKLAALPETTKVYAAHEYTVANLKFAKTVDAQNNAIDVHLQKAEQLRANALPTLPSLLKDEKQFNPFLRCKIPAIIHSAEQTAKKPLANDLEVFKIIRTLKDHFTA